MTPQGLERLQQKLAALHTRLKEIQSEKAIAYHASGDGWHDNPGWLQLGQQEEQVSAEIQKIQLQLAAAKVVDTSAPNTEGKVQIGSTVTFTMQAVQGGRLVEWTMEIAGSGESNIKEKRISYDSPIGAALLGKKPGDTAEVALPNGHHRLQVKDVV
jgi:transcription elongation factor GreA